MTWRHVEPSFRDAAQWVEHPPIRSRHPSVSIGRLPPRNAAPDLTVVKQTALDDGCGSALVEGFGNGSKNG